MTCLATPLAGCVTFFGIRQHGLILLILLASLGMRLAWIARQPADANFIDRLPDQREYLRLGQSLIAKHELSFFDSRFSQKVLAYRTPGYPVFVALLGTKIWKIRLAQALLDTSTVLAVYLMSCRLGTGRTAAAGAALLVGINPFLIYFCGLLLSETLLICLLIWGMSSLIYRRWILAAVLLAAAVLVRPSVILLGPLLAGAAVGLNCQLTPAYPWKRTFLAALVTLIIVCLGLLPWAIRNHHRLGSWIWTTTNSGITLYDGFNPAATGASDQRFIRQMPMLLSMNEVQRSQYLEQLARQWAARHPASLPALTATKMARTWSPWPLSSEFGRPAYRAIAAIYAIPLDLLAVLGLFAGTLTRPAKLFLLLPALYLTAVHAMSVGSLRYRLPAEPALCILAGAGITTLANRQAVN